MYFYNMFGSITRLFILVCGMVSIISCDHGTPSSSTAKSQYEVVIQHTTGDDYSFSKGDTEHDYLAYPFNMGYIRGKKVDFVKCIVLSKKMSARSRMHINPIGVFKTREQGNEISYIIAVPTDEQKKSVQIEDFSDLVTKYNSVKNIIEFWILNRCGLGCAENLSWGNESTASFVIESIKES